MKKSIILLLVLATLLMPILVSCSDTSLIEKIGQYASEFSGLGVYSEEEKTQQSEDAKEAVAEKFSSPSDIDFTDISNMLLDYPAADLEKTVTNIDKDALNDLAKQKLPDETTVGYMTSATDLISQFSSNIPEEYQGIIEDVGEVISNIGNLCNLLAQKSESDEEGKATLKDVQLVSAQAAMAEAMSQIAAPIFDLKNKVEAGEELNTDTLGPVINGVINNLQEYNTAASIYSDANADDENTYTIDIASIVANMPTNF